MQEKISVIVPIYNVEKYLEKCIQSILNQSYKNLEIILVDDGSPDNCPAICDEYAKKDSRIQVIHKKNGGVSSSRNAGLDLVSGEYIVFVDGDDYIEKDMVLELYKAIVKHHADMALCNLRWVDECGEKFKGKSENIVCNECLDKNSYWDKYFCHEGTNGGMPYIVPWNKIYHKKLWKNCRYPEGKIYEDAYLIHDIVRLCRKIAGTSYVGCNYVQHVGSIMQKKRIRANFDVFEAWLRRIDYFMEINKEKWAENQLAEYGAWLINMYHLCSDVEEKTIFQKYAKEYCRLYEQLYQGKNIPTKERLKYFGFKKNPGLINIMMRMYVCIKG